MSGYSAVVTFESDRGEPAVWRGQMSDGDADDVVRRAVFRAQANTKARGWHSVVVVITRNTGASDD